MTKERFEELMRKGGVTSQENIDGAWEATARNPLFSLMEEIDLQSAEEAIVETAQQFVAKGLYS